MVDTSGILGPFSDSFGSISGFVPRLFAGLKTAGLVSVIMIFAGILLWYIVKHNKYNTKVLIYALRADNTFKIIKDKASIVKTKYGDVVRLKVLKRVLPLPPFSTLMRGSKGETYLSLLQTNPEELYPVNYIIKNGEVYIKPISQNLLGWLDAIDDLKKHKFDWRTFISKNGAYFCMGGIILVALILVVYSLTNSAVMVNKIGEIAQSLRLLIK